MQHYGIEKGFNKLNKRLNDLNLVLIGHDTNTYFRACLFKMTYQILVQ